MNTRNHKNFNFEYLQSQRDDVTKNFQNFKQDANQCWVVFNAHSIFSPVFTMRTSWHHYM